MVFINTSGIELYIVLKSGSGGTGIISYDGLGFILESKFSTKPLQPKVTSDLPKRTPYIDTISSQLVRSTRSNDTLTPPSTKDNEHRESSRTPQDGGSSSS